MDDEQEATLEWSSNNPPLSILAFADEVILNILRFLDYTSLVKCALTCKKFNQMSKDWRLYREVDIDYRTSKEFIQWFIDRTSDPKRLKCVGNYRMKVLLKPKLSMWLNLQVLHLDGTGIGDVRVLPLHLPQKQLRILRLNVCGIHHGTLAQLLKNNRKLCRLELRMNRCDCVNCLKTKGFFVIPLEYLVDSKESLEEVSLLTSRSSLLNLRSLSDCHNLKNFSFQQMSRSKTYVDHKLIQDLERVMRNCNKLEVVQFKFTAIITDQFLEIMFENCPNLKRLKFEYIPLISEKSCLTAISCLEHLENLTIVGCTKFSKKSEVILKAAVQGTEIKLDMVLLPA